MLTMLCVLTMFNYSIVGIVRIVMINNYSNYPNFSIVIIVRIVRMHNYPNYRLI